MNRNVYNYHAGREYGIPPGLKELMTDISREVLREQPANIYVFIANYLEALLDARNCCRAVTKTVHSNIKENHQSAEVEKMYGVDASVANAACTKIQAAYRGYSTRKNLTKQGIRKK